MNSREYHIERLCDGNIAAVEQLHADVYGKMPPDGFFAKKYDTAFTGVKYVGYIAYTDARYPAAFYAVIPCFIQVDGKTVLSAQSADTMTHPLHRNRGLFVELATLTFQLCRTSAIGFIFGFPNQNSLPGFIYKLNWKQTELMDCFIIPCANFSLKRYFSKVPFLKDWYFNYKRKVLGRYKIERHGSANSVFNDGFGGVCRDEGYLQYKTYTDTFVIKVDDAIFWIKVDGILLIGDISTSEQGFDGAMNKLKKLARKAGIKEIHFHASPGIALHRLFATAYNSIPSFPVIFKDFAGDAPTHKIKFTTADIDTF